MSLDRKQVQAKILELHNDGKHDHEIATELAKLGVVSRRGGAFSSSGVNYILKGMIGQRRASPKTAKKSKRARRAVSPAVPAKAKAPAPAMRVATSQTTVLRSIKSLLEVYSIPAEDRVTLALLALEQVQ